MNPTTYAETTSHIIHAETTNPTTHTEIINQITNAVTMNHIVYQEPMNPITNSEILKIKSLSDLELEFHFEREIKLEIRQQLIVIYYMREIDSRRIWAEAGFSSLAQYCRDKFKMSDTDIYRKIDIMRTLRELPELENKLLEGKLTTTTLAKANLFFAQIQKQEKRKFTSGEKRVLLTKLENLNQKSVEKEIASQSPFQILPDQKKFLSRDQIRCQFTMDVALDEKLERLKGLLAHSLPKDANLNDLLHKICDVTLDKIDPLKKKMRQEKRVTHRPSLGISQRISHLSPANSVNAAKPVTETPDSISKFLSGTESRSVSKSPSVSISPSITELPTITKSPSVVKRRITFLKRAYQSVNLRTQVWRRDQGICTYVNPLTNIRCGSCYGIEIDHIIPVTKGGKDTYENLRLLCAAHNQLAAIKELGKSKMRNYVPDI